jgi:nitrate reductase NapAB chaperone NapD
MPVFGLVLTLEDAGEATRTRVSLGLGAVSDIELGDPVGHRWPVVLDSNTAHAAEARVDMLRAVPGVANVDIVYADFEDLIARGPEGRAGEEE